MRAGKKRASFGGRSPFALLQVLAFCLGGISASDSGLVIYGSEQVECPCGEDETMANCANLASDLWMQGSMDAAMACMDFALTRLHGSQQAREATMQNLEMLYGIRLRTESLRYIHGFGAKQDWIFPPLGVSKGLKDRSIRLYKNALPDEFCDYLVRLFERDTHLQYPGNILGKGVTKGKKNMEIDISDPDKGEWSDIDWYLLQKTTKYLNLYEMERSNRNLANSGPLGDEGFRMKRYLNISEAVDGKEFHTWHSDGGSASSCYRALAVVYYLNDVEEGGETVFLTEGINIKPKKGSALIWPTGFMYTHAGLPPISGSKYIITNFLRYTAPRIFNTLDIDPPVALQGVSRVEKAIPGPTSLQQQQQHSSRSSLHQASSSGGGGEVGVDSGTNNERSSGNNRRKRKRRRRRKAADEL